MSFSPAERRMRRATSWQDGKVERVKTPADSQTVMFQRIAPVHCDMEGQLDIGELLRWGDLATCAAAEAHCECNCVTVAVSDMSFETGVSAVVGDTVELHGTPVNVGNTSMVIRLLVMVDSRKMSKRVAFCSAQFTYVTLPGPDGKRVKCPPLDTNVSTEVRYAAFIASERRKVLQKEGAWATAKATSEDALPTAGPTCDHPTNGILIDTTTLRMTELVLPPHTNHMTNTFGGQIMAWMHKAAMICAERHVHTKVPKALLETKAVSSVEFPKPSKTADHLLFSATVQRVFPPNDLLVSVHVQKRVILEGSRIETINNGLFHLQAYRKPGELINVPLVAPNPASPEQCAYFDEIAWRWQLMTARGILFGFRGGALPLLNTLVHEAYNTTLEGILRMLPEEENEVMKWVDLSLPLENFTGRIAFDLFGQDQMGVKLSMNCPDLDPKAAFDVLHDMDARAKWDPMVKSMSRLESVTGHADVVVMRIESPTELLQHYGETSAVVSIANLFGAGFQQPSSRTRSGSLRKLSTMSDSPVTDQPSSSVKPIILSDEVVEVPLLRCWKSSQNNEHILAFRSVQHEDYDACDTNNVRLPTGWVVQPLEEKGCRITHVWQLVQSVIKSQGWQEDEMRRIILGYCQNMKNFHKMAVERAAEAKA
mmetsp:Transcript_83498/g.174716  ORF Transcript_83498/g.174716 Transcript_83498/m.174716 type:complete len:653 (+) Transcript_83498:124-2082(+)